MAWFNAGLGSSGGGGGGSSSHNYSTNEQVIGTWIDGSTVYEKTLNVGTISVTTTVAHGITNLNRIIEYSGFGDYAGANPSIMPYQGINPFYAFGMVGYDSTIITLARSSNLSSNYTNAFVILRYTKTT